jgi:REP element-mobilizing transposase RayT
MPGTYTNLLYHFVFSTKNRLPLITREIEDELHKYLGGIIRGEGGTMLEVNGIEDHLHMIAKLKPTKAVSDILRNLKANSSKWLNEEKLKVRKFSWQDGYAAFTVSESQVPRVRQYIRRQKEHHRRIDFKAELLALLEKHRVEYDEQYLWD